MRRTLLNRGTPDFDAEENREDAEDAEDCVNCRKKKKKNAERLKAITSSPDVLRSLTCQRPARASAPFLHLLLLSCRPAFHAVLCVLCVLSVFLCVKKPGFRCSPLFS